MFINFTNIMKYLSIVIVAATTLTSCSTVNQVNTDFKNFCKTLECSSKPFNLWSNKGWHSTCKFCAPHMKCNWSKCRNKNL